ncbi:hypothetical protein HRbin03_00403 [archaeon HR03]|uniref:Uncharacterized protein n=1 Tax=uncultured crenarchaeote TaxID=29281 RepID=H5SLK0_9CREN|nr:hypothetical protein HGMM_F46F11C25 [uncultured crenarchaeote]GBC72572.1 hypothetical protein HRbin03_00403 [archaeon HR03]
MDRINLLLKKIINDVDELVEEARKGGIRSAERVMEHVKSHLLVLEGSLQSPDTSGPQDRE